MFVRLQGAASCVLTAVLMSAETMTQTLLLLHMCGLLILWSVFPGANQQENMWGKQDEVGETAPAQAHPT